METNLDQKQLLVLGYLRDLVNTTPLKDYQLTDIEYDNKKPTNGRMSPMLSPLNTPTLAPMGKLDEQMTLFGLGASLTIPQSPSEIPEFSLNLSGSFAATKTLRSSDIDYTLPLSIIQSIYLYYHRFQNFLLLLGGSEECKDNSYNAIQIINLRNISDIQQNIDYPYTNYKLKPHLWRDAIDYNDYFMNSLQKYTLNIPQSVKTPQPIMRMEQNDKCIVNTELKQSESSPIDDQKIELKPSEQYSENTLSPYAMVDGRKMMRRPRAKSTTNIHKLKKKDIVKIKAQKRQKTVKSKSGKGLKRHSITGQSKSVKLKSRSKGKRKRGRTAASPEEGMSPPMMRMSKGKSAPFKKKKHVRNIVTYNRDFDRYSYGECMMSISNDIHGTIPSWPWFQAKYDKDGLGQRRDMVQYAKYKMYIRCGGIYTKDDEYTNENDLILFNAANLNDIGRDIDCYFSKLPSFKQKIESPGIVYNGIHNILSFGGYSYDSGKALKTIYSLNLNTEKKKFKWRKYACAMTKPRYDVSVTHIVDTNRFIIIGGKGSSTKPIDTVEMFNASRAKNASSCSTLKELNFKRFKPGSCELNGKDHIAVCGGILYGKGTNTVEIYDLHKDMWMIHDTGLVYDHQHPSMWCEVKEINPHILYVAGNNIAFGAKKGSMGFIEWTDLRENKKKFNLLYDEPIEELYELWGIRPNIWEPRSLLHFML